MLRHLLVDGLLKEDRSDQPRDPSELASSAARSATQWIGASLDEREKVLRDLLELADALPPQPKHGPSFPDKILSLDRVLKEAGIPHAFGGALAVGFYGEPRATGDIDINVFIPTEDWLPLRDALTPLQIEAEVNERELRGTDQLRLEWGGTPVHLFFSCDSLHEQMCRKLREVPFNGEAIPLVAPEHLVIRKVVLDRPKDWHDIEQILVASSPLMLDEVNEWLRLIAGAGDARMARFSEIEAALDLA